VTKKESKRLVIDASVARSTGKATTPHPTGQRCRTFLYAVFDCGHLLVMTPDIRDEWNKHQSGDASQWRRMMVAKRRLYWIKEVPEYQELWDTMDRLARGSKQREEMFKDIRLIEAAIAADRRIISLDDNTARQYFADAAKELDELKTIIWVNPDKPEENAIAWLSAGAPDDRDRMLGFC